MKNQPSGGEWVKKNGCRQVLNHQKICLVIQLALGPDTGAVDTDILLVVMKIEIY